MATRTFTLNFLIQAIPLIEQWLSDHQAVCVESLVSVNTAMLDHMSIDVIVRLDEDTRRVLRIATRLRHHQHRDVTLRMGSYQVKGNRRITLTNVLGKAHYANTWIYPQQVTSDIDEDNRVAPLLRTMVGNLQLFLLDPYPNPHTGSLLSAV